MGDAPKAAPAAGTVAASCTSSGGKPEVPEWQ